MRGPVTPKRWRRGFSLCRRRTRQDSLGEQVYWWNLEEPDLVVQDGDERGIAWQPVRSWNSGSHLTSGRHRGEQGERDLEILQGVCRWKLETAPGDRYVVDGGVYQLNQIQQWPEHRLLLLERVK